MALRKVIIAPPSGTTSANIEYSGSSLGSTNNLIYLYNDFLDLFSFELTIPEPVLQPGFFGAPVETSITIPHLEGYEYNYIIDYGDGTVLPVTTWDDPNTVHIYLNSGNYTVSISGLCETFYANYSIISNYITRILSWGNVGFKFINFGGCLLLLSIPNDTNNGLSNLGDLNGVFYGCSSLKTIMPYAFNYCTNVTSCFGTFWYCTSIQSVPSILFRNCINVTDFSYVFSNCTSLKQVPSELFSNCNVVNYFGFSFESCYSLSNMPYNLFNNCTNVIDFSYTFQNCISINKIPPHFFDNCPLVISFQGTFNGAGIINIPDNLFDYCISANNFYYTFSVCTNLTSIPNDLFKYNLDIINMQGTFNNCISLTYIPDNLFVNNTLITDFSGVFYNCTSLTYIPSGLFDNNTIVEYFNGSFSYCTSLTGMAPELWLRTPTPTGDYCFIGDELLNNYYCIPESWGGLGLECTTSTTSTTLYNYLTSWTNVNFDTFNSSGTEITSAIEASGTSGTGLTNSFYLNIIGTSYISIHLYININSGTGVRLRVIKDGVPGDASYIKTTSGNFNVQEFVSTGTWQVMLHSYDTDGVDFSATNCYINLFSF